MKNLGIKSAAVSVTMAVLTGAILLGVHVASGVDAPAQSPSTAGNVGPTFSGVKIETPAASTLVGPVLSENITAQTGTTKANGLKIQTGAGYVIIGPENSSFVHFLTDVGKFYFNRDIAIGGTGIIQAYGTDLELQTRNADNTYTTKLIVDKETGNVGIGIGTATPGAKLDVDGSVQVVDDLNVSGDINTGSNIKMAGALYNYITSVSIDDDLDVAGDVGITGDLYNSADSVLKINDDLDVESIKNTKLLLGFEQALEVDDGLVVTGGMKVMNGINTTGIRNAVDTTNTPLQLTDADGVSIDGPLIVDDNLSVKGSISNPNTTGTTYVKVADELRVDSGNGNPMQVKGGDDDGNFEWVGWYSGASRAGIFLWDGIWNGCDADKFCIFGGTHQLMLKSNTGNVLLDDDVEVTGTIQNPNATSVEVLDNLDVTGVISATRGFSTGGYVSVDEYIAVKDLLITGLIYNTTANQPVVVASTGLKVENYLSVGGSINDGGGTNNGGYLHVNDGTGLSVLNHLKAGSIGAYSQVAGSYQTLQSSDCTTTNCRVATSTAACPSGTALMSCQGRGSNNSGSFAWTQWVELNAVYSDGSTCYATGRNNNTTNRYVQALAICHNPNI